MVEYKYFSFHTFPVLKSVIADFNMLMTKHGVTSFLKMPGNATIEVLKCDCWNKAM